MASGKLTPRQKMINMMYLVLTALLAMNVSKEILNSFAILNNGLVKTNENFTVKNAITYGNFETALLTDRNKVQPYLDKAKAMKTRAEEMFNYIEQMKTDIVKQVEKKDETTIHGRNGQDSLIKIASNVLYMEGKDDYQAPTYFFMGDNDKAVQGNKAFEFKEKIKKFKDDLKTFIPVEDRSSIKLGLETEDIFSSTEDMMISWENNNFYHNPAVAVIAILTKMQNDVKNAEANIINALYNRMNVNSYKFDTLSARVNPNTNYVLIGDEYKAEIFVAGFSTTSDPQIWLGEYDSVANNIKGPIDSTSVEVKNGVGIYTKSPESEGTTELNGIILVINPANPKGPRKIFPFHSQFKSAKPAVVVAPESLNVFYRGLDNPVAISVPGIASEDLVVNLTGCSGNIIKKSNGEYIVKVTSGTKGTVNVAAKMKDGTIRQMGKGIDFRIKQVPKPIAQINGKQGSAVISQAELSFLTKVFALPDPDFVFAVNYPVVSFKVTTTVGENPVEISTQGSILNEEQKKLLKRMRRGNKFNIENVIVQNPDGTKIDIGNIILKVI